MLGYLAIMHQNSLLLGFAKFAGLVHAAVEKVAEDGPEPVHIHQKSIVSLDGFERVKGNIALPVLKSISNALSGVILGKVSLFQHR